MGTTPLKSLPYPELTDIPAVQADIKALALAVDAIPTPPAAVSGLLASRPAASASTGGFYYATDQDVLYFSNGTTWTRIGLPVGSTTFLFGSAAVAAPTGWVRYDGTNLPASTGIYADLYAHLGNSLTKPDTQARVPVDKGTHTDVDTNQKNEGITTVASRRQRHQTTKALTFTGSGSTTGDDSPDHTHNSVGTRSVGGPYPGFNVPVVNQDASVQAASFGANSRHQHAFTPAGTITGSIGTNVGTDPVDSGAYYVGLLIAKL